VLIVEDERRRPRGAGLNGTTCAVDRPYRRLLSEADLKADLKDRLYVPY